MKGSLLKKGFAALAAFAVGISGLALGVTTASAAVVAPTAKTITITGDESQLTGHTFTVAKIGAYDASGDTAAVKTATPGVTAQNITDALTAAGVTGASANEDPLEWAIENTKLDQSGEPNWYGTGASRKFADALAKTVTFTAPASTDDTAAGQRVLTVAEPGLYLVKDTAPADHASTTSLTIMVGTAWTPTAGGTAIAEGTVKMKNQVPNISKDIKTPTPQAGKDVTYTLTSKVPNYVGYRIKNYQYRLVDSFQQGVAPSKIYYTGANDLTVTVAGKELTKDQYTVTYYTVENPPVSLTASNASVTTDPKQAKSFRVDLSKYVRSLSGNNTPGDDDVFTTETNIGAAVLVTYKAHVVGDLSQGAINKPGVEYSNNPTEANDGDTPGHNPGPEKKIFNFPFKIKKTDKQGNVLSGASFKIEGADGTTMDAITKTSAAGGIVSFTGLGDVTNTSGQFTLTYKVTETQAPLIAGTQDHYQLPSNAWFTLKITGNIVKTTDGSVAKVENLTYTVVDGNLKNYITAGTDKNGVVTGNDGANPSVVQVTLYNAKNITELPLTGGMGTALFTVIAVLLAGAAATVFAKSRRTSKALQA
ncbi:SpaA isopeptide-forming pilin-related protein [Bifidobacterium cebidarum]|uniref:Collagen-binding protein n=1 Tax=Bifidobacterium cebidarum TaxID=2650773 RepID=A0A6I1GB63_9BIFI|nr:LPXTG cell wall anchor domain-containing protein [Bifidobacterium cebidarum]KAB7788830.1 collagen-binding protein [Bifidobacterium cebidarum]